MTQTIIAPKSDTALSLKHYSNLQYELSVENCTLLFIISNFRFIRPFLLPEALPPAML
jgi:hypothetical protein